ncbi:hypothetical protein FB45DRAFT_910260 [Roridomyces roridus]|uniref:DUF7729 domain-containing protein n=1 Tax=Roridomyces roridus TaxID=1738132 RepID=A0AAD7BZL1_9AGAR|nr:hypothetical protein FB45DRAFT_910260 [Roridomyces roridus]
MFTPPPSPAPLEKEPCDVQPAPVSQETLKRRIGRRTRWSVIVVPIALLLITASTRYLTHPAAFDIFSEPPVLDWETLSTRTSDWATHEAHLQPRDNSLSLQSSSAPASLPSTLTGSAASTGPSSVASELPTSAQIVPAIPASPPALPTPFPQPFDSQLSQNFSSLSCFNFFANMTNTAAFRSCRPFALLLQSSDAFINAQDDLDSLNSIVWGTCNTTTAEDQCSSNMAWFSATLATACSQDLAQGNSMAVQTQTALNAFDLMRNAGCLADPATNTYCYLDAVHNSNPSDTYFYSIPLGVSIPNNTIASCSACTKSLMTLYYDALSNQSLSSSLTGLHDSYESAAKIAVADCGTAYATLATTQAGSASPSRTLAPGLVILAFVLPLLLIPL